MDMYEEKEEDVEASFTDIVAARVSITTIDSFFRSFFRKKKKKRINNKS